MYGMNNQSILFLLSFASESCSNCPMSLRDQIHLQTAMNFTMANLTTTMNSIHFSHSIWMFAFSITPIEQAPKAKIDKKQRKMIPIAGQKFADFFLFWPLGYCWSTLLYSLIVLNFIFDVLNVGSKLWLT